jgi:hypothetical protein
MHVEVLPISYAARKESEDSVFFDSFHSLEADRR